MPYIVGRWLGFRCRILSNLSGATSIFVTTDRRDDTGGHAQSGDTMDEFITPPAPVLANATPTATVAAPRSGTALWARVGLLGIGAAAILAAAILLFGSTASPLGTLAAGTATDDQGAVANANGGGPGFAGGPGGRGGFGHGPGGITITAISGTNISLETLDGWTRTITVDAGTAYSEDGEDIALADLAVDDEIAFRQTREDDGSFTIDAIVVIPPNAGGEVTAVSGSSITVSRRDGSTTTINVNAGTTYQVNGAAATLADVEVGMVLMAQGTENADGSLTATEVRAANPGSFGNHAGRGFKLGPGPDGPWGGTKPDATEAPTATDSSAS